jgi:hypothetical protein
MIYPVVFNEFVYQNKFVIETNIHIKFIEKIKEKKYCRLHKFMKLDFFVFVFFSKIFLCESKTRTSFSNLISMFWGMSPLKWSFYTFQEVDRHSNDHFQCCKR